MILQNKPFFLHHTLVCFLFLGFGCTTTGKDKPEAPAHDFVDIQESTSLASDFREPPASAHPWAFWWWLEGSMDEQGIRKDLQEMKKVGIAGAIVFDAGSSSYTSVEQTAAGPEFMGKRWRNLFADAVRTADSLGLQLSFNIGSGWNDGGPWVTPKDASKKVVWSEWEAHGATYVDHILPLPEHVYTYQGDTMPYFKPIAVLAIRKKVGQQPLSPLENLELKAVQKIPGIIANLGYDWEIFLKDTLRDQKDDDALLKDVIDISNRVDENGRLQWEVPEGTYTILRFGYTGTGVEVSTYSPGGGGLAIDYMSREAMDLQFNHTVGVVLQDVGELAGKSLKYLHDDSWELGAANWTPAMREAFKQANGYDLIPFLPVMAGKIIESRDVSDRFLYDFRRTIGDLIAKNHYQRFSELAHEHHMGLHSESGGPHPAPIDALKNLGIDDIPMGEFWARAKTHRVQDYRRIFVKQGASAAHIYGRKLMQAEGPTSIGPHWEVDPWHIKPTLDRVFCEGMNRMVFHTFTHSPASAGIPGNEYFAGTHFNPNITWWQQAPAFTGYISRCQLLLQQGRFVGDVCFYYGDNVPNQVPLKRINPSLGAGYDYDVTNTEVILTRMNVRDGRIFLPDGMNYALLALPDRKAIPLKVLKKLEQMVKAGAIIVGPKPSAVPGLEDYGEADEEVTTLADTMWGDVDGQQIKEHTYGKGKVIWGKTLSTILMEMNILPDFSYQSNQPDPYIDYIHRTTEGAEIYFIANRNEREEVLSASFRIKNKVPELWFPENGKMVQQSVYVTDSGRVRMPLRLDPFGSVFVVFRNAVEPASNINAIALDGKPIYPAFSREIAAIPRAIGQEKLAFFKAGDYTFQYGNGEKTEIKVNNIPQPQLLNGSWKVHFSPEWGGPDSIHFDHLISWTDHPDKGIQYYSGTASYHQNFSVNEDIRSGNYQILLDLGEVHNLAEVYLNGKKMDVLWKKPFMLDISEAVKAGENTLQIKVVNLWPNRIIGDQFLPEQQRFTQTNVRKFTKDYPLLKSGLIGPVQLKFYPVMNLP